MDKLSQILWRERELLDTLLLKLEQEQMVLARGRTRWFVRAAREVEGVLTTLRETEILRAVAADEVAASCGLEHNPSLRALSAAADEPWRTILSDHHDAFSDLMCEISALAETNRDRLTAGSASVRETLVSLDRGLEGYRANGAAAPVTDSVQPILERSI